MLIKMTFSREDEEVLLTWFINTVSPPADE